jgi:hypothetical protein
MCTRVSGSSTLYDLPKSDKPAKADGNSFIPASNDTNPPAISPPPAKKDNPPPVANADATEATLERTITGGKPDVGRIDAGRSIIDGIAGRNGVERANTTGDFPGYVGVNPTVIKPVDKKTNDTYKATVTQVDAEITAGTLKPEQRKEEIVNRMMTTLCGEKFNSLPDAQKAEIKKFLMSFDLNELMGTEQQGVGGAGSGAGVTGSGSEGHYTNSIMSSVTQLVNNGRMTPDVTSALNDFTKCDLNKHLVDQRNSLIRSTIQEIAFPESINQHAKGTCAATSVQIQYAVKSPDKYVKMIEGLASPDGEVPKELVPGGGKMERVSGTMKDDKSGRSISSRLIQPAFMEYANGDSIFISYNNKADEHTKFFFFKDHGGLFDPETNHLLEGLYGKDSYVVKSGTGATIMPDVEKSLNDGNPVVVGMRWRSGGHEVLLTKVDKVNNLAYYMNPWGALQTMPLDQFTERMDGASISKAKGNGKPAMESLPGAAGDPANYAAVDWYKFQTKEEHMKLSPVFKNLTAEKQKEILDKFASLDLSIIKLDELEFAMGNGRLPADKVLDNFLAIKDKDQASRYLGLLVTLDTAVKDGSVAPDMATKIIESHAEKYLNIADFAKLDDAVMNGLTGELDKLLLKVTAGKINEKLNNNPNPAEQKEIVKMIMDTPNNDTPSPLLQLLADVDVTKLAGKLKNESEASGVALHIANAYKNEGVSPAGAKLTDFLEKLGADTREVAITSFIDEAAKQGLLKEIPVASLKKTMYGLMEGFTNRAEEKAVANILGKVDKGQLAELLKDPKFTSRIVDELKREDIVGLMTQSVNSKDFSTVSTLFAAVWKDKNSESDSYAEDFVRGLSTDQLNSLPKEILQQLHKALDDGYTTSGEKEMMKKLEKAPAWPKS